MLDRMRNLMKEFRKGIDDDKSEATQECEESSHGLTDDQITDLRQAFSLFDKEQKGHVSTGDLGVVMKSLGQSPTEDELRDMINEVDIDGNGVVDFDEFVAMMSSRMRGTDDYVEAFKVFDKDGNGFIDACELQQVMATLGENFSEEDIKEMLTEADLDGDGLVSFEEFKRMMDRSPSQ